MVTYYAVAAGGNWQTAGTWSSIATKDASRTSNGLVPGATIDCVIDDWSGSVTVGATSTCKSVDFNGGGAHAGTFTVNAQLTIAGNFTCSSAMTVSGGASTARRIALNAAAITLTTAGKVFNFALYFPLTTTLTLVGDVDCTDIILNAATITMAGAYNITTNTISTPGVAVVWKLVAGQTLTITDAIYLTYATSVAVPPLTFAKTIQSTVASTATYVNYTGTDANQNVILTTWTDVDASGGSTIYSYQSGTLTRVVNVKTFNPPNAGGGFIPLR